MANSGQAPFVTCVPVKPDTVARRSANYHPSIWGDHFLAYSSYNNLTKADAEEEKHDEELEQVKKLIVTSADEPQKQLKLIDDIQRLGVAYHFETEIEAALQSMNIDTIHQHDDDLHNVALCFRLLRQQGHNVTSDVFYKFKDNTGKLKEQLKKDARGVLSLYEATQVRVHGEEILDEAAAFTTSQLELLKSDLGNPYAVEAIGAIKCPIRKCLNRLEARRYISIYQQDESHNELLLNFAKLDFNFLQKEHQQELAHLTRWWKEINCAENFPFARDRMVECYFWILGVYFEPQYLMARRFLTKIIALTSIADDLYDVYGTLEELVILTDAIERWDMRSLDQLPGCMRIFYRALLDVYNEMEEELVNTGKSSEFNRVHYAKASYTELLRAYLAEAKWFQENHVPTLEEYMSVALISGAYKMLSTHSYVGMGEIATREAFDWLSNNPLIIKATSIICRLSDDMVGHEFEQKRGHVASAVDCYMKEHGVTKADAYKEFKERIVNAWKDMNQECVRPTAVAMPLLLRIYNLACVINLLYVDGEDCYTHSNTRTKDFITSVLVDPVPV